MLIDSGQGDWLYVVVLAVFAFVANAVANLLSFDRRWLAALLAAVLFTALFVFWTYYPHGLPLPTSLAGPKSSDTAVAPAAPATSARPRNPVTDITPPSPPRPSNPVTDVTPAPRPSR